ncbi:MAG TPA: sorbosone dehydrogenase family protein [Xanthomonadales bacterium]|nr:sorbosone dehydrogenase family protein [Xanthomonadales bacterium]
MRALAPSILAGCFLAGCGSHSTIPEREQYGANPPLPEPNKELIPTIDIAPAVGWTAGGMPRPGDGLVVQPFATGLEHPRWLRVLPNGDVLVAETAAPERPLEGKGIKGKFMGAAMKKAGSAVPSANRITLLRDADGDGVAETKTVFAQGLNSPFGMDLVGDTLYVANTDGIVRFDYREGATSVAGTGTHVADLPGGERNHHWTKNVIASRDGATLYATVGSNSNVAEHGMQEEVDRAAILEVDPATGATHVFASGLRNPNGMAWNPETGALWTVVNERDEIGSDLVPDYLTSVKAGAFYGWPYSYYGQHEDSRPEPKRPDLVAKAIPPDYALGSHTASLGLAFYTGDLMADRFGHGAIVGQHGSWNRKPPAGYRVIFVPFANGMPDGEPQVVLDGFLDAEGNAQGRPVGVAVAKDGAILVADDVGNAVWRVAPAETASTAAR